MESFNDVRRRIRSLNQLETAALNNEIQYALTFYKLGNTQAFSAAQMACEASLTDICAKNLGYASIHKENCLYLDKSPIKTEVDNQIKTLFGVAPGDRWFVINQEYLNRDVKNCLWNSIKTIVANMHPIYGMICGSPSEKDVSYSKELITNFGIEGIFVPEPLRSLTQQDLINGFNKKYLIKQAV